MAGIIFESELFFFLHFFNETNNYIGNVEKILSCKNIFFGIGVAKCYFFLCVLVSL